MDEFDCFTTLADRVYFDSIDSDEIASDDVDLCLEAERPTHYEAIANAAGYLEY